MSLCLLHGITLPAETRQCYFLVWALVCGRKKKKKKVPRVGQLFKCSFPLYQESLLEVSLVTSGWRGIPGPRGPTPGEQS